MRFYIGFKEEVWGGVTGGVRDKKGELGGSFDFKMDVFWKEGTDETRMRDEFQAGVAGIWENR